MGPENSLVTLGTPCRQSGDITLSPRMGTSVPASKFSIGLVLLLAGAQAGCSWVDSTGTQADEALVITLDQANVVELIENQPLILDPGDSIVSSREIVAWRWGEEPVDSGNLQSCSNTDGFLAEFVAPTIEQACAKEAECEMYFQQDVLEEDGVNRTVFLLRPPLLNAPVGVTYQLFSTDSSAIETSYNFTFCLIAINEAPVAMDDTFSVVEQTVLSVTPPGPNLLSNDTDDTDISNLGLTVETQAVRRPQFAAHFELFSDGGFEYEPVAGLTGTDSFQYRITDGYGTSDANVIIRVVAADAEPELIASLNLPQIVAGLPVSISLATFFNDPEGSELVFSAVGLPPGLELTSSGDLQGNAAVDAIGEFPVTISVSDGTNTLTNNFSVTIEPNLPPLQVQAIPGQSALEGASIFLAMAGFFEDPEGVELVFGMASPTGLAISIDRRTGIITGVGASSGTYELTVNVSDGVNPSISAEFELEIVDSPNRRPVYDGALANQNIDLGDALVPIVPDFTDPDGDVLSYELIGSVPEGVSINELTGVVGGTPLTAGIFRNLAIRATDSGGLSANSDTFNLIINLPIPNRSPVYTGSIPNQDATQGELISPIFGNFSDPDDDLLEYEVDGQLPAGLAINTDGAITGTPTQIGRSGLLSIVATDPSGASVESDNFRITVSAAVASGSPNTPPEFDEFDDIFVTVDEDFSFSVSATDADGDPLEYEISGPAAAFLQINESTGFVRGSIPDTGDYSLVVTASDADASTSIGISIVVSAASLLTTPAPVAAPNQPPEVTDIPNRAVTGSFSVDVTTVFTDPDGDDMTYTAQGLPAGLQISSVGIISGTASSANRGPHFIVVTARDGFGGSVSDGFVLTII